MSSPAGPFKLAQDAALRASAALVQAMGLTTARLYTEPPANAPLPYVVTGDDQILIEVDEFCADEAEIFATVTVWSRATPLDAGAQARAVGLAVIIALNAQLAVTGWDVDLWELQSESYSTNPDQSTRGVLVFHYLLTKQVA